MSELTWKWHDAIGGCIDQVGHPDYSLRQLTEGAPKQPRLGRGRRIRMRRGIGGLRQIICKLDRIVGYELAMI